MSKEKSSDNYQPFSGHPEQGQEAEEHFEQARDIFLADLQASELAGSDDPEHHGRHDLFLAALSAEFYAETVQRSLDREVATNIDAANHGQHFRHQSALVQAVGDDPLFAPDRQLMIDLDSTLFPLEKAVSELGVNISSAEIKARNNNDDIFGDLIVESLGRGDLQLGAEITAEQRQERGPLIVDFFERLHVDSELMQRAGVFEFAPQIIDDWRQQGIKIHIVTHRSPLAAHGTEEWLRAMNIGYDYFICDSPSEADKIAYCQQHAIPVLIDDKPQTIIDAEAVGIEAVSLAWPYSAEALEQAGGDPALCWRQVGQHAIEHIEKAIIRRAKAAGRTLPV
jgi:phosphoglycolate phosphatase-like HAD superfamily hydrolase